MKEQAIEALVEKEQIILELRRKLEETENFYREQMEVCFAEIRGLQDKIETLEEMHRSAHFDKETESMLEEKNQELRRKFLLVTEELDRKERENSELALGMQKIIAEKVEERLQEILSHQSVKENVLRRNTIEELEDRDEFIRRNEKEKLALQARIAFQEEQFSQELAEYRQKLEESRARSEEELDRIRQQYEKQVNIFA